MKCHVCKKELIPRQTILYQKWQKAMSEHSKARIKLVVPLERALKSAEEELERVYGRPLRKAYHAWSGLE